MRVVPSVLVLVCLALTAGCGGVGRAGTDRSQAPPSSSYLPVIEPVMHSPAFAGAIASGTRTKNGLPGDLYWQQTADYDIEARLVPEEKLLDGRVRIRYQNNSPSPLSTLRIELALNAHRPGAVRNESMAATGGMLLQRVAADGEDLAEGRTRGPRFVVQGTQLAIVPRDPIAPGSIAEIEIDWTLPIPEQGAAGRMGHSRGNLFFLAYWYPCMAVYDDVDGWHTDQFLGSGEFYHGFGNYRVTIEAPPGWIVTATGELENPDDVLAPEVATRLLRASTSDDVVQIIPAHEVGGIATRAGADVLSWRFRAGRVRDFAFSATNHSIWEAARASVGDRDGDGTEDYALVHALYRPEALRWERVVSFGQDALSHFSDVTGYPYPWPHVTLVEGSPIVSGGMEYPMMSLIGDYSASRDADLYTVVAHEIGHMWVPMLAANNERRYGWLDEGLTEFASGLLADARYPDATHRAQTQRRYMVAARRGVENEIVRWSDYLYPRIAQITALYYKPSSVLGALMGVLGDDVFWEAYRSFIATWAYRHPHPHDFYAAFERVSGRDLSWFWRSWYYETWHLDQAITDVVQRDRVLYVRVENLGRIPMPVHLAIRMQSGELVHHVYPAEQLWLAGQTVADLQFTVDGPVQGVEIDPDYLFPDIERSNNVWP